MWNRSSSLSRIVFFLALFLGLGATASALEASGQLQGKVRWHGDVHLKDVVLVAPDAILTIAPGTVVRPDNPGAKIVVQGVLRVEGTERAPVRFAAPPEWLGIEFIEAGGESLIEHAVFEKAKVAVSCLAASPAIRRVTFRDGSAGVKLLRESYSVIEDCLFVGNDIGIDSEMKSVPAIRRNTFRGHKTTAVLSSHNSRGPIEGNLFEKNKQGIGLLQKYPDRIVGNRFIENGSGIFCNQTQNTPLIRGNAFERNENALVNFSFSYPTVENNTFIGNQTAIRNDQFGSPQVTHNLFRENGTALYNNRKSNPVVEKNVLEKNGLALYCDYSSYPRVRENNFTGNKVAVELGIYQSADWEKRAGSKSIVQEKAQARRSQNPLLAQAPTEFNDFVDVRGNWWGKDTARLEAAGPEGNVALFFDRRDKPSVTYEGYGEGSYTLDWVRFAPWLEKPVAGAGPEQGR